MVVGLVADLKVKIDAHIAACVQVKDVAELTAVVDILTGDIQTCAKAVVALGTVKLDAAVEADLVAKVATIISENILSSQSLKELWELPQSSHQAQKGNPEGKF
ncbi:hypothetical protein FRC11_004638 [Ceratobasidium sp. 423]|nr:hypothetical protein FRC11_004638 [Ceratobasidium sp. 423]